jgi:hypothetical protein
MKNGVFWGDMHYGSCNDVSEELSASIIRVTRIGELGPLLVVTSRNPDDGGAKFLWNVGS